MVEKHFTLSRDLYGPDARFAIEPDELEDLVDGIREIETMLANPVDKDDLEPFAEMKRVFEKSVVTSRRSPPAPRSRARWSPPRSRARGSPRAMLAEVVGRTARVDIAADTVLTEDVLA